MKSLLKYYHLLSIDVIFGVLAGAVMAVKITGIQPGFAWWIVLPSSVWWIYLTDHLIDGLSKKEETQNPRHHFFYKNRTLIFTLLLFLSFINIFLIVFFLPRELILFGGFAGFLVLIYLAGVKFIKTRNYVLFPKEIIVALLYTGGIWGGLFYMDREDFSYKWLIPLIAYFLVTVSNLFIYSFYEQKTDKEDKQITIFTTFEESRAKKLMLNWFVICIVYFTILIFWRIDDKIIRLALDVLAAILAIQLLLFKKSSVFSRNFRYRWVNEGAFLLPSVFLLLN